MQNLISNNQTYLELYQKGVFFLYIYIYIYGRRAKPHPIYNIPGGVSLSSLSMENKYIYIYTLSLYIYISLSLSIYIYIYMRAGQTSPHMINNYKQRENHQDEVLWIFLWCQLCVFLPALFFYASIVVDYVNKKQHKWNIRNNWKSQKQLDFVHLASFISRSIYLHNICIYIFIHTHIVYIYIYIYTFIHTHIYIYIYIWGAGQTSPHI